MRSNYQQVMINIPNIKTVFPEYETLIDTNRMHKNFLNTKIPDRRDPAKHNI
jgi:hypothetical protein